MLPPAPPENAPVRAAAAPASQSIHRSMPGHMLPLLFLHQTSPLLAAPHNQSLILRLHRQNESLCHRLPVPPPAAALARAPRRMAQRSESASLCAHLLLPARATCSSPPAHRLRVPD